MQTNSSPGGMKEDTTYINTIINHHHDEFPFDFPNSKTQYPTKITWLTIQIPDHNPGAKRIISLLYVYKYVYVHPRQDKLMVATVWGIAPTLRPGQAQAGAMRFAAGFAFSRIK
jgi:hypothetical protein